MKILYICRLYSGFEESCKKKIWNPKGSPTIARMIETLDKSDQYNLKLVFTTKDYNSGWKEKRDVKISLDGLKTPITVLAGKSYFPYWFWKFQEKFSDLRQFWNIYRILKTQKPDLVYCDRTNIFPAAMLARFTRTPVIWRVMGVLQIMKSAAASKSIRGILLRFLWRSPFAHVVCSMDGSGGNIWMDDYLSTNTPRTMLLNGFDFSEEPDQNLKVPESQLNILFSGRLEPLKNSDLFLEMVIKHLAEYPAHQVIFAGYGSELEKLQERTEHSEVRKRIIFLGALNSAEMKAARQQCDIHVSTNEHGNLTNVNLEAIADGLVVIVPNSVPEKGVDVDTDDFIPNDVFYRYGDLKDETALLNALKLFSDKTKRENWQKNSQDFASKNLKSWDERIQQELDIFSTVMKDKSHD